MNMNSSKDLDLQILFDKIYLGYTTIILDLLIIISIICAIFILLSKNPIVSVLYLIGLFISIASYLIIVGVNFIGLSYLLIYIGAISILFIFILMLINIRISELISNNVNSTPLVIMLTIILNIILYNSLPTKNLFYNILSYNFDYTFSKNFMFEEELYTISNVKWDSNILNFNNITTLGNTMYTNNSIWLIIASIILLLAMIGAIVVTVKPLINNREYNSVNKKILDLNINHSIITFGISLAMVLIIYFSIKYFPEVLLFFPTLKLFFDPPKYVNVIWTFPGYQNGSHGTYYVVENIFPPYDRITLFYPDVPRGKNLADHKVEEPVWPLSTPWKGPKKMVIQLFYRLFKSYKMLVWVIGTIISILMIVTIFLSYVLIII